MNNYLILGLLLGLLTACGTTRQSTTPEKEPEKAAEEQQVRQMEQRQLDTMVISAPPIDKGQERPNPLDFTLPPYKGAYTLTHDLVHTKLEVSFDWEQEAVLGKAELRMTPYFYPSRKVLLDAKDFAIHRVAMKGSSRELDYTYDSLRLAIDLGQTYKKGETYTLVIDYTAYPKGTGGSAAIISDQGLFFINADGSVPGKPQQIWTQGETEYNSRWFPTIDKPNERCTQEILITVEDRFKTLSNGDLISSIDNRDGTRTDYWKMDQSHAPYLFMLAIGEFAVVEEAWKNVPVSYYVEPEFKADARNIFPHTTEMLDFFSDILDVDYPWSKYAQVVVRDFVSGAMENTTASVFGEFVQQSSADLIDDLTNDKIVAHELFHQWFGNYVTCESWANLAMNEGFANYSEYLWLEHKYGRDEADYHLLNEWDGYFGQAIQDMHPLIHFSYDNKEDMFDAHSYNKGGAILHMLRYELGDDAFFAGLNKYLTDNAYTAVEAHDLRLAFEEVTGRDLYPFFDQWYFSAGHPKLQITYDHDSTASEAVVVVEQTQDPTRSLPIFKLDTEIDIYQGEEVQRHNVLIDERLETLRFPADRRPDLMTLDPEYVLLAEINDNKTQEEFVFQYFNGTRFLDRYQALRDLEGGEHPRLHEVLIGALDDPFWAVRSRAIMHIEFQPGIAPKVRQIARQDPHAQVRSIALEYLAANRDTALRAIALERIQRDSANLVRGGALYALSLVDNEAALPYAKDLAAKAGNSSILLDAIGQVYAQSGNPAYLPFFEEKMNRVDGYPAMSFIQQYQSLVEMTKDARVQDEAILQLQQLALNQGGSPWRRFAAFRAINDFRALYRANLDSAEDTEEKDRLTSKIEQLNQVMQEIREKETNEQLKGIYQQLN